VGRTFIQPEQRVRDFGVRMKLNPVRSLLEGKRIILIDDSIIRGTTSRKIVRMCRSAGAKEVHLRISCPPTISPCFYGVDTPHKRELIAANNTVDEICKYIEADSLAYLSLDGLLHSCASGEPNTYCTACYTGNYPTQWVDVEDILPALELAVKDVVAAQEAEPETVPELVAVATVTGSKAKAKGKTREGQEDLLF